MRKLVIVLAFTSAAFAGSTVYFARQLSIERERLARLPAPAPAAAARLAVAPGKPEGSATSPPPAAEKSASDPDIRVGFLTEPSVNAQPMSEFDIKKAQAEYSKQFLARVDDPERREEMLAEYKLMMRYSLPRVDQVLGLSPEENSRLLELFAQQQIDAQEKTARCMADPACQLRDLHGQGGMDSRKREIDELLGAERAAKLETYKNTLGEREAVNQLRNRLPEVHRLSDASTELLVTALAEERDRMHREAAQRGGSTNSFNIGAGMVLASTEGDTFEERYETAKQNSQRLRDRAAQFLNAEQMRAFNEMQDETLISLRSALRNKGGTAMGTVSVAMPVN